MGWAYSKQEGLVITERSEHTIGAEVEGLRVPEQHAAALGEVRSMLESGTSSEIILSRVAGILSTAATLEVGDTEIHDGGVLNTSRANFDKRFQPDLHKINTICTAMRELGHKIVLTSGTFDIIHIGHAQYLEAASRYGDFLVVGVDSDEKVRQKKGDNRPVVSESERLQMLAHMRSIDLLTLKKLSDPKWQLIRVVQPDTLIATEGTYTPDEVSTLENAFVERVVVLPPQATTSTSARLRLLQISQNGKLRDRVLATIDKVLETDPTTDTLASLRTDIDEIFGQKN